MNFIDHFSCSYTYLTFMQYSIKYVASYKSKFLWMSAIKLKNNMGIIGNDVRIK